MNDLQSQSASRTTRVDIIVPVRDEQDSVARFVTAVASLTCPAAVEWRIIFVEDGSRDRTVDILSELSRCDPRVCYFSTANGFGEGPAVMFGASRSDADAVIMMAADGSHPIDTIPRMIESFQNGCEVVQCTRASFRGRTWSRRTGSWLFGWMYRVLTGYRWEHQDTYYRLASQRFVEEMLKQPRYWRLIRFPLPTDASLCTLRVDMVERDHGASTYGFTRLLGLALDGVLALMTWPRVAAIVAACFALAFVSLRSAWQVPAASAALAGSLMLGRYRWLDRADYLGKLILKESSMRDVRALR